METKKYLLSLFLVSVFIISAIFVTAISKDWVFVQETDKGNIKVYNTPNGEVITDHGLIIERNIFNESSNGDLIAIVNGTEKARIINTLNSELVKSYDEKDKGVYVETKSNIDVYYKNEKYIYYETLSLKSERNTLEVLK